MEISKETVKQFWAGQTTVGTDAVPLTDLGSVKPFKGIILRAPGTADDNAGEVANLKPVWVGPKGVTTATGFPILPGKGLGVPIEHAGDLYVVSNVPDQIIAWIAF